MNRRQFMIGAATSPILATTLGRVAGQVPRTTTLWNYGRGGMTVWRKAFKTIWEPSQWVEKAKLFMARDRWFESLSAKQWDVIRGKPFKSVGAPVP